MAPSVAILLIILLQFVTLNHGVENFVSNTNVSTLGHVSLRAYIRDIKPHPSDPKSLLLIDTNAILRVNVVHKLKYPIVGLTYSSGYVEGVGEAARFNAPHSFVIINKTKIIVSDRYSHCLREVDLSTRLSSPFAGTCQASGFTDGPALQSQFSYPWGLLPYKTALLIADPTNNAIRYLDDGTVSTLVKGSPVHEAYYFAEIEGTVYVITHSGVLMLDPDTATIKLIGGHVSSPGFSDGPLLSSRFTNAFGLVSLSPGLLLLADHTNDRLRLLNTCTDTAWSICIGARGHVDGAADQCQVADPWGIAILNNTIYVGVYGDIRTIPLLSITQQDVRMCGRGVDRCSDYAYCASADAEGFQTCRCKPGFYGDGCICHDKDECLNVAECSENGYCTNAEGSYMCNCRNGFSGDGRTCHDEDECLNGAADCSENGYCTNTNGSYMCNCTSGFAGDGKTCLEGGIQPCKPSSDIWCSGNAGCVFDRTTFALGCECKPGYEGDGEYCKDIDECQRRSDNCAKQDKICLNLVGSYECRDKYSNCVLSTETGQVECHCNLGYEGNYTHCQVAEIFNVSCPNPKPAQLARGADSMNVTWPMPRVIGVNESYVKCEKCPPNTQELGVGIHTFQYIYTFIPSNYITSCSVDINVMASSDDQSCSPVLLGLKKGETTATFSLKSADGYASIDLPVGVHRLNTSSASGSSCLTSVKVYDTKPTGRQLAVQVRYPVECDQLNEVSFAVINLGLSKNYAILRTSCPDCMLPEYQKPEVQCESNILKALWKSDIDINSLLDEEISSLIKTRLEPKLTEIQQSQFESGGRFQDITVIAGAPRIVSPVMNDDGLYVKLIVVHECPLPQMVYDDVDDACYIP